MHSPLEKLIGLVLPHQTRDHVRLDAPSLKNTRGIPNVHRDLQAGADGKNVIRVRRCSELKCFVSSIRKNIIQRHIECRHRIGPLSRFQLSAHPLGRTLVELFPVHFETHSHRVVKTITVWIRLFDASERPLRRHRKRAFHTKPVGERAKPYLLNTGLIACTPFHIG